MIVVLIICALHLQERIHSNFVERHCAMMVNVVCADVRISGKFNSPDWGILLTCKRMVVFPDPLLPKMTYVVSAGQSMIQVMRLSVLGNQ